MNENIFSNVVKIVIAGGSIILSGLEIKNCLNNINEELEKQKSPIEKIFGDK
jgi:hypothetical protein